MESTKLAALVHAYPMDIRDDDTAVIILRLPIGDNSYVTQHLDEKLASTDRVLTLIQTMSAICDLRFVVHAHRLCAQDVNLSMSSASPHRHTRCHTYRDLMPLNRAGTRI
jgi:hypothetical protein